MPNEQIPPLLSWNYECTVPTRHNLKTGEGSMTEVSQRETETGRPDEVSPPGCSTCSWNEQTADRTREASPMDTRTELPSPYYYNRVCNLLEHELTQPETKNRFGFGFGGKTGGGPRDIGGAPTIPPPTTSVLLEGEMARRGSNSRHGRTTNHLPSSPRQNSHHRSTTFVCTTCSIMNLLNTKRRINLGLGSEARRAAGRETEGVLLPSHHRSLPSC